MISSEKVGNQNLFWCFPLKDKTKLLAEAKRLESEIADYTRDTQSLAEREAELMVERPLTENRKKQLMKFDLIRTSLAKGEATLKEAQAHDPEEVRKYSQARDDAKLAMERWTDNTFSCIDYMKKKFSLSQKDAARQLRLPEEFDYVSFSS